MGGGGEAAHVGADLGDDHRGRKRADARDGSQPRGGVAEGLETVAQLGIDLGDRGVDRVGLTEMDPEQQALVVGQVTAERLDEPRTGGADAAPDPVGEAFGITLALGQRVEDRPSAGAHDVGEHRAELEVGGLQELVDAFDMGDLPAGELLTSTGKVP